MIAHGDEIGRTQQGNNNVYCQDNELSWMDWDLTPDDQDLLRFTQQLVHLRLQHPVLRRRRFFAGFHRLVRRRRPPHGLGLCPDPCRFNL